MSSISPEGRPGLAECKPHPGTPHCLLPYPHLPQEPANKSLSLYKQGHRKTSPLSVTGFAAPAQPLGWNGLRREPPKLLPSLLYPSLAGSSSPRSGYAPRSLTPTSWRRDPEALLTTHVKAESLIVNARETPDSPSLVPLSSFFC